MARGNVKLRMYWDQECKQPVEHVRDENEQPVPVDLGEVSYIEGGTKTFQLYLKNEGDRTYYIGNIRVTARVDLTVLLNAEKRVIKPSQIIPLDIVWDMAKADEDLRFDFALEGKFYVFGE